MAYLEEPSEIDISSLCDVFGVSRAEAINRLKANGNNVENAVNEYLDDPDSTKYTWNESHFNTDREGETNAAGISFNIQGADEIPPLSHVNSTAPTRPPSRTNNRSPLAALLDTSQEDADFARALAESAAESGIAPQEVGIIPYENPPRALRASNRSNYDSDMWAVVPTKAMVESADPPASARKRDVDAPAFLQQTTTHRLGALLSIYSKIPLARNFLLSCGRPALAYGHNTEWWKGSPILRHEVLGKLARGEDVWGDDEHPDFIEELHRLLAFLDKSERSYASADILAKTKEIDRSFGAWPPGSLDIEDRFFQALQDINAENPAQGAEHMVTTGKVVRVMPSMQNQSEPDGQNEEEESSTTFIYYDIAVDADAYSCINTLYDALDHFLWSSALSLDYSFPEGARTAVLSKPAEVLTVRFGNGGLVKPCEIPAVFYADRYLESHRELAVHFQTQIREIKNALKKLDWSKEERVTCTGQLCCFNLQGFNIGHDVRDCCTKLIQYAEQLLERQKKDAQWRHFQDQWEKGTPYSMDDLRLIHTWSSPLNLTEEEEAEKEKWEKIIEICKDKLEQAGRALTEWEEKKEELNGYLEVVRKRLTCQEDEIDNDDIVFRSDVDAYHPEYWHPSAKYLLRGVVTTHELAYVCTQNEEEPSNNEGTVSLKEQWWKIGYIKSDASPIKSEKVTLDDVLQAAGTECKNPILIYASAMALNQERIPLSDALRMFVKADNRSFQQELAQEEKSPMFGHPFPEAHTHDQPAGAVTAAALSQIPSDPKGKRKYSVGSSIATNGSIRSDLAGVDLTFDDAPIVQEDEPETAKQHDGSKPLKLGEVVASLAKCQTDERVEPAQGERKVKSSGDDQGDGYGLNANTASTQQVPEMSERRGGANPFLAQPGGSAQTQNSIDLMDLDSEHEITDS
ncbi:hypothetical protein GGS21DRAFT_542400 [Xylaria nigripes]|nr:hypothetical protein GGS21DRAFT_542400 [Xylaria nigripes]